MKRASNSSFAVAFVSRFHSGMRGGPWKKAMPATRSAATAAGSEAAQRPTLTLFGVRMEPDTEIGAAVSTR